MYAIKNKNNEYLTRRTINSDYSFTDNNNLAYVWDDIREVEALKNILTKYQNIADLKIVQYKEV